MTGHLDRTLAVATAQGGPPSPDARRHELSQRGCTEQQLRTLVEGVPHLIWQSSNCGMWTWASPQWIAYTGQTQEQSLGHGWLGVVHPDDQAATVEAWNAAAPHGELDVEFRLRRERDGAWVWHRTTSLPVRDRAGWVVHWAGSSTDIQAYKDLQAEQRRLLATAERQAQDLQAEIGRREQVEEQLGHAASHDDLTGLRNRAWFMRRLRQALAGPDAPACSVLFLDLDRFKQVNDSLGHRVGDLLLGEVAGRLQACTRATDTLARLGGDEFVVLAEGPGYPALAEGLAHRIIEALGRPAQLDGHGVVPACSIGVVHVPPGGGSADTVLSHADTALREAKACAPGSCVVFSDRMREKAESLLLLEADLAQALQRQEFTLEYQPICDAGSRRVVGVEALIRWRHPRRGNVPPGVFVPLAERAGLVRAMGQWMLQEACGAVAGWLRRHPGLDVCLNVNASAEELRGAGYLAGVRAALDSAGLDPRRLQIEVTEGVFLQHPEATGEVLSRLRALGTRIALDDFGTGYSSLGYLSRYPVDSLKVDRSFVSAMLQQPRTRAVVEAVVGLGRAMDLAIVGEGVEEEAQLQALRAMGCGLVQGHLLGHPMDAAATEAALAQRL